LILIFGLSVSKNSSDSQRQDKTLSGYYRGLCHRIGKIMFSRNLITVTIYLGLIKLKYFLERNSFS
jgi:hypothetical protein